MSSAVMSEPSLDETPPASPENKTINWGMIAFFTGIVGLLVSSISQHLPSGINSYGLTAGASIVTLAAIVSYICLFQPKGRKYAFWSMLLFSIASPVLFFISFMSYME